MRQVLLVAALASVLACASSASAQPVAPRDGAFTVGVSTGIAATKVDCSNCGGEATYGDGWQTAVSALWRVNTKMQVGLELVAQPKPDSGQSRSSLLLATTKFHPWAGRGLFIRGGFGLLWVRTRLGADDDNLTGKFRGVAVNYGAGWHFRAASRVSWALHGEHYPVTVGTVEFGGFEARNVIGNVWVGGVTLYLR